MAGKKFLNPYLKLAICFAGMLLMGYFLVQQIQSGEEYDRLFLLRTFVFAGFLFLLVRTAIDLFSRGGSSGKDKQ